MCAHYPPAPGSVFSFCWDFRLSLTSQGSVWWRDIEQSFTRRENSKSLSPSRPLHSSGAEYLFHSSLTFGAISSLIDYIGCILVLHTHVRGWCMLNNNFSATFSAFYICSRWSGKHIFYTTQTHTDMCMSCVSWVRSWSATKSWQWPMNSPSVGRTISLPTSPEHYRNRLPSN